MLLCSCNIGVRTETTIVYSSIAKTPEAVSGLIRVATNEPVSVTVNDKMSTLDIGGYYVVSAADLEVMINNLKEQ